MNTFKSTNITKHQTLWFGLPPSEPDTYTGPIQKAEKWVLYLFSAWITLAITGTLVSATTNDPIISAIFQVPDITFFKQSFTTLFSTLILLNVLGLLVDKLGVNVAITRKTGHILGTFIFPLMVVPTIITGDLLYQAWYESVIWRSIFLIIIPYALLVHPIRSRVRPLYFCMRALDRPEDRPYTLFWFTTQMLAISLLMIPMTQYFVHIGMWSLFLIPAMANGLGDGLAEPLGKIFGKRRYEVKALFTNKTYTRSYIGSSCVAFFTALGVILNVHALSSDQFWFLLITLPIAITFIEARSPHTWDNFFIYAGCGGFIYFALLL